MTDLDPRWDWIEERVLCQAGPSYVRGQCNHLEVVPVESVLDDDVVLAHLCVTCDRQLPAEWRPSTIPQLRHRIADLRRKTAYARGGFNLTPPTTTELNAGITFTTDQEA